VGGAVPPVTGILREPVETENKGRQRDRDRQQDERGSQLHNTSKGM
jgi:hypothetical protein